MASDTTLWLGRVALLLASMKFSVGGWVNENVRVGVVLSRRVCPCHRGLHMRFSGVEVGTLHTNWALRPQHSLRAYMAASCMGVRRAKRRAPAPSASAPRWISMTAISACAQTRVYATVVSGAPAQVGDRRAWQQRQPVFVNKPMHEREGRPPPGRFARLPIRGMQTAPATSYPTCPKRPARCMGVTQGWGRARPGISMLWMAFFSLRVQTCVQE